MPHRTLKNWAEDNFREHQQALWAKTDRMFAWMMLVQYLLAVAFALFSSPKTYQGANTAVHPHVWLAVFLGGLLASYPVLSVVRTPGAPSNRFVIAFAQAAFSALLIHVSGGRIETHFHVFGSLAFLAMYRDWRVVILASVIVAVDHFVRGTWFPLSVYGEAFNSQWRFVEHASWVAFEDVFLIVGIVTNVREMRSQSRKQAELQMATERLTASENQIRRQSRILESVLTTMKDGVIVSGGEGEILSFNPAAGAILGPGSDELRVEEWPQRFRLFTEGGEELPAAEWPFSKALDGKGVDHAEFLLRRADTAEAWLEISAHPLVDQQGQQGAMVVFRDVTDRKRALTEITRARQEAERANRAKSEFLSRMSHELRTPMNAILGFGQLLKLEELTSEQEDSVEHILRGGAHLLRLINEVLDISGIESGNLTLSREPVDLKSITDDVLGMVRPLASTASVTIEEPILDPAERFVMADQQRLMQVVLNVVTNGIKYNVPGGTVRIWTETRGSNRVLFIQDSGKGVPLEKQARLFHAFDRLGAEASTVEGTGLGLALSRKLLSAMGGTIEIVPSEVGACFAISVPLAESPFASLEAQDWLEAEAPIREARADLLIVEDNPANILLLQRILEGRTGIKSQIVRNGGQALAEIRRAKPNLVLLDMDLPDGNGLEVLKAVRASDDTLDLPVIIVSADANPSNVRRALDAGATDYLVKPYNVKILLNRIADFCPAEEVPRAA